MKRFVIAAVDIAVLVGLLVGVLASVAVAVAFPAWAVTQITTLPLSVTVPGVALVWCAAMVGLLRGLDQPETPGDNRFPRPLP